MNYPVKDALKSPAACLKAFRQYREGSEHEWWISLRDIDDQFVAEIYVTDLYDIEKFTDRMKEELDYMQTKGYTFCWVHYRKDKRDCCAQPAS